MKRVLMLLAAGVLVLAAAAPAAAAKPVLLMENDYDFTVGPFTDLCDFPHLYRGVGHESYKEWYDRDGFPVKGLYQNEGYDIVINADTGKEVAGHFRFNSHLYGFAFVAPDTWTWLERVKGAWWNIQLPGEGLVLHESGLVRQSVVAQEGFDFVYTVTDLRGRQVLDPEALCRGLAAD